MKTKRNSEFTKGNQEFDFDVCLILYIAIGTVFFNLTIHFLLANAYIFCSSSLCETEFLHFLYGLISQKKKSVFQIYTYEHSMIVLYHRKGKMCFKYIYEHSILTANLHKVHETN